MVTARHSTHASRTHARCLLLTLALLASSPGGMNAQSGATTDSLPGRLPFGLGEVLDYQVHVSLGGNIGRGQMRVEGPVMEQGVPLWRLVSEMQARRAFVRASDRSSSWVDAERLATRRFEKVERSPLGSGTERVEIDAVAGVWRGADGRESPLASPQPLDELSFLYFLRTLPLDAEGTFNLTRHYDEARNPTLVSVGAEETVQTPSGTFTTRMVVMHVRDPKHYKGIGLIKVNVDLSPCRLPVRIVSRMPIVGTTTLTLISRVGTCAGSANP